MFVKLYYGKNQMTDGRMLASPDLRIRPFGM
jgi:hypothetical protein